MEEFAIYFDLDGVHADYDAGIRRKGFDIDPTYKNDLNRRGTGNPLKRQMYEAVKGTSFYYDLPLLEGADRLYNAAYDHDPIILTAAPLFGAAEEDYFLSPHWLGAAYHKRRWVEEKLLKAVDLLRVGGEYKPYIGPPSRIPIPDERFICTTSPRKAQFMHRRKSARQILVDDRLDNCRWWYEAGGEAILHTTAEHSIQLLKLLMAQREAKPGLYGERFLPPAVDAGADPARRYEAAIRSGVLPHCGDGSVDFSGVH